MYFEDLLLTVYTFTIAISSWCIDSFYHYEWLNLFLVIFLKFILFETTIVTPVHAYCLIGSTELRRFQKSKMILYCTFSFDFGDSSHPIIL